MEIMIESEKQKKFRETNYKGKQINIIDSRENEENRLFSGRIKEVNRRSKDGVMFAQVKAVSYTADLDTGRSRCSFQDIDMTYEQVVNEVTQNSEAEFIWSVEDKKIVKPFIQYEETNWGFMRRLASHYNCPLHSIMTLEKPRFSFGVHQGKQQKLE